LSIDKVPVCKVSVCNIYSVDVAPESERKKAPTLGVCVTLSSSQDEKKEQARSPVKNKLLKFVLNTFILIIIKK
jgi:hypothetical protein